MAGNGEEMADALKEQKAEEEGKAGPGRAGKNGKGGNRPGGLGVKAAGAGVGRKTVAELVEAAALIAATKKPRKRRSSKDGAEMLKQASDQALVEITGDIVEKLKDAAKDGDVVCVKTLMSFSERKKPRAKVKRKSNLLKWIEEVEKERQWEGPPDYGDEEGEMQGIGTKGLRD
jgi:hypothetical protein